MNEIIEKYLEAKATESAAKEHREKLEAEIIAHLKAPEDGSKSHNLDGYKVTTQGRLNYKADMPHLLALASGLPEKMRPIKTETILDRTGAKYLRANEPETWAVIAPAIEVTPGKSSIKVEAIEG